MKINSLSLFLLLCPKNKKYFYFLFFFVSNIVLSQTTLTFTKTGNGFWTVPCDVTSITVEAWGAGGAGGGTTSNNAKGGGGGGGGAYVRSSIVVSPGTVINFSIGAGAAGATSTGASGGDTWFVNNTTILAKGGSGGSAPNGGNASGGATLTDSLGDIIIAGGNGGDGTSSSSGAGGRGGDSGGLGGNGGATNGKGGDGSDGFSPGGGGGGAFVGSKNDRNGGSGGNGQIRITYTSAYCYKNFTTEVEPITNVTFAGIDNSTSATINGSYSNEYFCSTPANVIQGDSYNISLKGNTNGNFTDYFTVFIDWNQDGVFNNTGEKYDIGTITNSTGVDTKVLTGTILVPATALVGATKMKVVKNYNAYTDSCLDSQYGQAENYVVTVAAPPSCSGTPSGGTASLSPTSGLPSSTFTATVTGAPNNSGYTYQWQSSPSASGPWTDIVGATSASATITAVSFPTTTYYRRIITCTNSGNNAISSIESYTTDYCSPTFASSNTGKLYISSFRYLGVLNDIYLFDTLNNNKNITTQSGTNGNYQDFTGVTPIAEQVQGSVINIEAVAGGSIRTPAAGRWVAWVDWNKNGYFDSTENVYEIKAPYLTDAITFGFPIPSNQNPGIYRLRIAVIQSATNPTYPTDPCAQNAYYGEMEDYVFKVIEDNNAKLDTNQSNIFSRCGEGSVSLSAVGANSNVVNYKWYDKKYGGTLLHTGQTFTTPSLSVTTPFYVTAIDNNGKETPFRYTFIAKIDQLPIVTFSPTPKTICGEDDPFLLLSVSGDKREEILINETFSSGLGAFKNDIKGDSFTDTSNTPAYSPDWVTNPNFYCASGSCPTYNYYQPKNPPHLAIAANVVSGYFGGYFAMINTDVKRNVDVLRYLVTNNSYDTTGFIANSLKLEFDLYYFSIGTTAAQSYIKLQYSDNGGAWTDVSSAIYFTNQGDPLNWSKKIIDFDALSVPRSTNLKIRFSVFSKGDNTQTVSYIENIATLDNVKFYGDKPFDKDFDWSGADNVVLYDKNCTTPLGNTLAKEVCVKPLLDEFEKPSWKFNASATFQNGCPATGSTIVYNDTKIWNQPGKTDWKQSDDWKPVGVPDIKKCVIARTPVELPSLTTGTHGLARSVIVKSGGKLTIDPKSSLTIQNYLKNEAAASDVLVESDANLLQINNSSVNIGNITVKRNANLKRLDYTYWGSPVDGQNVKAFSAGTLDTRFYVYNESNDYFDGLFIRNLYPDNVTYSLTPTVDKTTYNFITGKGYAIRAANNLTSTTTEIAHQFVGVPYNGVLDVSIEKKSTGGGYNLISNPFPSNIDFYALYNYTYNGGANKNSDLIYQTAYFWTNTNFNPKMQGSSYPSNLPSGKQIINNYAVLNGTGGIGAPYGFTGTGTNDVVGSTNNCSGCKVPTNVVKVGQGFIVKAKNIGTSQLRFENGENIRTNSGVSNFFNRMSSAASETTTNPDRYWVTLKTPLDFVTPLLVGYVAGASNQYEDDFDAELLVVGGDSFYTLLQNKKLGIQGKQYPFNADDVVDLGARFGLQGTYEISLGNKEGVFANGQDIYLKDNVTGVITNLSQGVYRFEATASEVNDRFQILYTNTTLGTGSAQTKKGVKVYKENHYAMISSDESLKSVKLYDVSGKLIFHENTNNKEYKIDMSPYKTGVYVVDVITVNQHVSKRIIK